MGNCLDRTMSEDEGEEESNVAEQQRRHRQHNHRHSSSRRNHNHHHHHHHSSSSSSRRHRHLSGGGLYNRLSDSSSSLSSVSSSSNNNINNNIVRGGYLTSSSVNLVSNQQRQQSGASGLASSLEASGSAFASSVGTTSQQSYYLSPNVHKTAEQLTEEEQIKLLKRMTLVQQLPTGLYDGTSKKNKECVICMIDFELNDTIKYLPCMHTFHQSCIDNWLVRSLVCPSCIEPVDALILEHMIMNNE